MNAFQPATRRTFLGAALASLAVTATACGFEEEAEPKSKDGKKQAVLRQMMSPVLDFDPAIASGASFAQILMYGLMEGLVVLDGKGTEVAPGAAESWKVTDDNLTYTFTIRSGAKWSNGDPVTAKDFAWNWRRLLTPNADDRPEGVNSYDPATGVVGAMDYLNGDLKDFGQVGVKALSDKTLEIRLERPNPDLLPQLAAYWALPVHPGSVEKYGQKWADPANWVSNGAFVLKSFQLNASCVLAPNGTYWDKASYHIDRWEVRFSDSAGTADLLAYQQDEANVINAGRVLASIADDAELQKELTAAPRNLAHYLVLMVSRNPVLQDVRVRKALSLATNRDEVAAVLNREPGGYSLVPDGVPGSERVPRIAYDVEQAKALLAAAGYPDGKGMPTLALLTPEPTPWLEAVGEMWNKNLGVDTTIDLVESGVYVKKRAEVHPENYTGFYMGSFGVNPPSLLRAVQSPIAGLGRATHALPAAAAAEYEKLEADKGIAPEQRAKRLEAILDQHLFPEFRKFRSLAASALAETDPDRQQDLLVQAATAREESYVLLPMTWFNYNLLVKPEVKGLTLWSDSTLFSTKNVRIE